MQDEQNYPKTNEAKPDVAMADAQGAQADAAAHKADEDDDVDSDDVDLGEDNKENENMKGMSAGQLLWVQGANAGKRDSDMGDEDDHDLSSDSCGSIDPESKKKCQAAQDPDQLFTLNLSTYRVCQLNTLLAPL